MGLLDRIRNYRAEAVSFVSSGTTNKNAPPTFVPDLVRTGAWNKEDLDHLDQVATGDPVANYIVYKLSENTFDDWFTFVDNDGQEIMTDVQKELILLNAKKSLIQALAAERTFGYSWLYTGKNKYIPKTIEGGRIASLHTFTPKECSVFEYNEHGEPKTMEIRVAVGTGAKTVKTQRLELPAEDFIFLNTRPIARGYKGRSAIYSVWDMLVYLRYIYHAMAFYDMKIGAGVFIVKTAKPIKNTSKSSMDTAFGDLSVKRSLVIDGKEIDSIQFVGAGAGATDFEQHIRSLLAMVAAGTGIPMDVLIGVSAGAITGSETNIKSLFATLNQIQTSMEQYIRDLIKRMGYTNNDYNIAWNARYAHDEEEQSKIAMNKAQTLAIRSGWLTINEIRAVEGLSSVVGGDMLKADMQINVAGMQTPEERDQTRNAEGVNI